EAARVRDGRELVVGGVAGMAGERARRGVRGDERHAGGLCPGREVEEGRVRDVRDVEENAELDAGLDEVVAERRETASPPGVAARAGEVVGVRPGRREIADAVGSELGEARAPGRPGLAVGAERVRALD